ncbi:interleukin-10 receptor subunit alpha isoform X2 [Lepisosteus oculatus]|uniref:interleukin-10 receptor subunit alpha isoform X2 n=1 Tax=Lepisosteus oculatus TaxID=7918 RepID=UPI0035F50811
MRCSGQDLPAPVKVGVVAEDASLEVHWSPPEGPPQPTYYQVQYKKYSKQNPSPDWVLVEDCNGTAVTRCDLSDLITDRKHKYLARVRLVTEHGTSNWTVKRFSPSDERSLVLLPPRLALSLGATSLRVSFLKKPQLEKVFAGTFGLKYTIYVREGGHADQTSYVLPEDKNQWQLEFLQKGQIYCISAKVESISGNTASANSEEQCVLVAGTPWVLILMVLGCLVGVLAFSFLLLCWFLRRPAILPRTLKSLGSSWQPLRVGAVAVETVTSPWRPVWFLEGRKEEKAEDGRRGSADSGVSLGQRPPQAGGGTAAGEAGRYGGEAALGLEDSGCGSLGRRDSRGSEELPLLEERSYAGGQQKEDSGVSLGSRYRGTDSVGDADGGEGCTLQEVLVTDGYRSQIPASRGAAAGAEGADSPLGYRPSFPGCACAGRGACVWCRAGDEPEGKSAPPPDPLTGQIPALDCKGAGPPEGPSLACFPDGYFRKATLQAGEPGHPKAPPPPPADLLLSFEAAPLLIPAPRLPLVDAQRERRPRPFAPSLGDVELGGT